MVAGADKVHAIKPPEEVLVVVVVQAVAVLAAVAVIQAAVVLMEAVMAAAAVPITGAQHRVTQQEKTMARARL